MSQSSKIALWAVVAALIVGVVVWQSQNSSPSGSSESADLQNQNGNPPANPPGSQQNGVAIQSASNASLDQDLAAFDAEMKGYDNDAAAADEGLNDKPISQEE